MNEPLRKPAIAPAPEPGPMFHGGGGDEQEIDLGRLIGLVMGNWKWIAAITALCTFGALVYAFTARPIYGGDSLIQVEPKKDLLPGLKDLSDALGKSASPADTEIQILRSRSVLGPAIVQAGREIDVRPKRFPIFGGMVARRWNRSHDGLNSPWLWFSSYGWGGEKLSVERLDVPDSLLDKALTLVAGKDGAYTLEGPDGQTLLQGKVGEKASGAGVTAFVQQLRANPDTEFTVVKHSRAWAISDLRKNLGTSEAGKDTGIISVHLQGPNPARVKATLDAIDDVYLRQNVERKSAEAEKTLAFIQTQLPDLKAKLDTAEDALQAHESATGTVDLKLETKALLDHTVDVETSLSKLKLQRAELAQKFTPEHPEVKAIEAQIAQLSQKKKGLERKLQGLPSTERATVKLKRDVQVDTDLYLLLLNKAQELKVMKSGTIGNVRILDSAVVDTRHPLSPKKGMIALAGLVLGLMLGGLVAFGRDAMHRGLESPDELESMGLPVYAVIPHSDRQRRLARKDRGKAEKRPLLAASEPNDLAVESLRSLRTSLQFALAESKKNVLLITGLRPNVGKSFIAANLAVVMGSAGTRTLLVDGDLRRGKLHEHFGLPRLPGLSEVASGSLAAEAALRPTAQANLLLMATGTLPPNPSELLMGDRVRRAMEWAASAHDLVIIDSPPILAVTDAAILGAYSGVRLLVLEAGLHPAGEVSLGIGRLEQNGVRVQGAVLNATRKKPNATAYGRQGYHYHYEYR